MSDPNEKSVLTFTSQELADLRHLVSIAVWVRSEQMGAENVVMIIKDQGVDSRVPPIEYINEGFVIRSAMGDMHGGMVWWKRLTALLELADGAGLRPSWSQE